MEQPIISGYYNLLHTANTEYNRVTGGFLWTSTENNVRQLISRAGYLRNLRFRLDQAPGAGTSYTFTLRVNGADSALTCSIADTETQGSDTVHTVAVAAGDYVSIKCVPTGTPTARYANWTLLFDTSNTRESLLLGGHYTGPSTLVASYNYVNGGYSWANLESQRNEVISCNGTLKNLHILLSAAPGVGKSYVFTLRVNGAASSLTCTITGAATTGSDTTHQVTVAAGDCVSLECAPTANPNSADAYWGMTFAADTQYDSLLLNSITDTPSFAVTEYNYVNATFGLWLMPTDQRYQLAQPCRSGKTYLHNFYVYLTAAPGAGKNYTFTLRRNGVDTALSCSVSDTGVACHDTMHQINIAAFDQFDVKCVPSGSPTPTIVSYGFTLQRVATPLRWARCPYCGEGHHLRRLGPIGTFGRRRKGSAYESPGTVLTKISHSDRVQCEFCGKTFRTKEPLFHEAIGSVI